MPIPSPKPKPKPSPPPPGPGPLPLRLPSPARAPKDHRPPQEKIDEFWKAFSAKSPSKATTVIPQNEYAEKAAKHSSRAPERTTQSSYAEAAAICRTKVKKIADECRAINRKYRDPHFDLEYDLKCNKRDCLEALSNSRTALDDGYDSDDDDDKKDAPFRPLAVKRVADIFDGPQFFIDGPSTNDVRQGNGGDCWLLAALCTLSNKEGLIERICVARDEQVGVYGFVFHRDGEWFSEIIDDKLYLKKPDYDESLIERILWEDRDRIDSEEAYRRTYQSNSGALYFSQCENPNETWLPLLEKCYAKAHGDYAAIEGGFTGEGIEDLTGGVTTEIYTSDILDREAFWKNELMRVNEEFLFGCSTGIWGRGHSDRKGIVECHAHSVMRAVEVEGMRLVLLKNPWGKGEWKGPWSDGSREWTADWMKRLDHKFGDDGAFWISYADLIRKYQAFDRTRLFGDDWRVASIWTTLSIPWKHDYHDTHFDFTLSTGGEVVIVLSQLDDRYFQGLEGQYVFHLAFRLHRAGQEDYIVRTPPAYRMTRSVNVEVTLEAGDYTVMVKVDATRSRRILPVEDVIRNNAKTRREKLLRIGLAYDLAHSKGRYKESAEEKAARKAHTQRAKNKEREAVRKFLMKEKSQMKYIRRKKQALDKKDFEKARKRQEARGHGPGPRGPGPDPRHFDPRGPGPRGRGPRGPGQEGPGPRGLDLRGPGSGAPRIGAHGAGGEFQAGEQERERQGSRSNSADKSRGSDPVDTPPSSTAPIEPEPQKEADAALDAPKTAKDASGIPGDPNAEKKESPVAEGAGPLKDTETDRKGVPPPPEFEGVRSEGEKAPVDAGAREGRMAAIPRDHRERLFDGHPRAGSPSSMRAQAGSDRNNTMCEEPERYCESSSEGPPSDTESSSGVSDVTDREIDMEMQHQARNASRPMPPPLPPPFPAQGGPEKQRDENDPWNAVVVVGLRIYHKIPEEDKDKEVVKLRVVRPSPYSDGESESSGSSSDEGGDAGKKRKVPKLKTAMSKGLDVDDSAKDATLEGTENERKLTIDPSQAEKTNPRRSRKMSSKSRTTPRWE